MPAFLSPEVTLGVGWTLVALCIVLSATRYALRAFIIRIWYWDDLWHAITLIIFIVQLAVYQALGSFRSSNTRVNLQLGVISTILGYSSLWTTKFAFLAFYRLLFKATGNFNRAWWTITILTFLAYWAVIGGYLGECGGASEKLDRHSCSSASAVKFEHQVFIYTYCLNVGTDLAIMALPLHPLSSLNMPMKRKLGIAALFCSGFIIIMFDTLRFGVSYSEVLGDDPSFYAFFETAACIIVSCGPTLPALRIWKNNGFKPSSATSPYTGHLQTRSSRKQNQIAQRSGQTGSVSVAKTSTEAIKDNNAIELSVRSQNMV